MSVYKWVISLTWNCEPAESDSQDQEGNGNSFRVRVSHHQQESGLHSKAWNTFMQTHLFHVWIAQYWQYWLSEGNAVNIRTIAIKMVCAHIHKLIFPHQNENKLYLFGLMMLVSQSKSRLRCFNVESKSDSHLHSSWASWRWWWTLYCGFSCNLLTGLQQGQWWSSPDEAKLKLCQPYRGKEAERECVRDADFVSPLLAPKFYIPYSYKSSFLNIFEIYASIWKLIVRLVPTFFI